MKVVIMLYTNVCCKLTLGRLTGERYKCKLFTVHFGKSEISSGIRRGLSRGKRDSVYGVKCTVHRSMKKAKRS